jgi:hypothetical protein
MSSLLTFESMRLFADTARLFTRAHYSPRPSLLSSSLWGIQPHNCTSPNGQSNPNTLLVTNNYLPSHKRSLRLLPLVLLLKPLETASALHFASELLFHNPPGEPFDAPIPLANRNRLQRHIPVAAAGSLSRLATRRHTP